MHIKAIINSVLFSAIQVILLFFLIITNVDVSQANIRTQLEQKKRELATASAQADKYRNARGEKASLASIQNIIKEGEIRSPLKKVIDFTEKEQEVLVSLTDNHLARAIGDALYKAHNGVLEMKYSEEEKFVRMYWHRDT